MILTKKVFLIFFLLFVYGNIINADSNSNTRWWGVYFTRPWERKISNDNPGNAIIRLINNSQKSFYGAFYDISSVEVCNALINVYRRGTDVKLVIEGDNYNNPEIKKLVEAGIQIATDNRRGLMHNKFAISDDAFVWTGSCNLTQNGFLKNNNNSILLRSSELALIFHDEFLEMYKYGIFGNKKEPGIFPSLLNKYYVKIGNSDVNVYFSPENNIERIIVNRIKKADKSIYFMMFSFTSNVIGDAIIKKYKQGIKVNGIFEKHGSGAKYSEYIKMKVEGLPVILDKNRHYMHHKVMIIDESLLITGSFNFSKSANKKNDENIIIINNTDIAGEYIKEFHRLKGIY